MYNLPELPYRYDALEPYIDQETMWIHHQKHQQGYVDGLNKALRKLKKARQKGEYGLIRHWERELAFNGSGHFNHSLFWKCMCPPDREDRTSVTKSFYDQVKQDFGSVTKLKEHFTVAAKNVEGSGWGMLVWEPNMGKLMVQSVENQQNEKVTGTIPLLVLDVWEHAYYLKYQNERGKYIENWWNVVNWKFVSERFFEVKNEHRERPEVPSRSEHI